MNTRGALAVFVATAAVATSTANVGAAGEGGPCRGRTVASRRVDALLVGGRSGNSTKLIVHLSTTSEGMVGGTLVLGRGSSRLEVTTWCRLWEGSEGDGDHGDMAHAIGEAVFPDGVKRYVRVDVASDSGGRARIRTKAMSGGGHDGGHSTDGHQASEHDDEGHGGWQSLTGEGWLSLTKARIGSTQERVKWLQ